MKTAVVSALVFSSILCLCAGFDMVLEEQKDMRFWKFRGDYIYANSLVDGGRFAPDFVRTPGKPVVARGVWYFHFAPYSLDNDNYHEMKFALKHQLMYEVAVRLLAHPRVPVVLTNGLNQTLGKFWSTGKSWCDAIVAKDRRLGAEIKITVNLTESGTYALVDTVTLGVATTIQNLNRSALNPCRRDDRELPPTVTTLTQGAMETVEPKLTTIPPTQATNPMTTSAPQLVLNNKVSKLPELSSEQSITDASESSIRVVRSAVPTTTATTSTVDGLKCDCTCNCLKVDENE